MNSHTTLDLLAEYNDHTNQRDKAIEHIERRTVSEDNRPSYDDLFKENVKLKLQIQEQATEIESLIKVIEGLRDSKSNTEDTVTEKPQSVETNAPAEIVLPPRSADRNRNTKNLRIPIPLDSGSIESSPTTVPLIDVTSSVAIEGENADRKATEDSEKTSAIDGTIASPENTQSAMSLATPQMDGSPATSVQYTTSRISITSPHSPRRVAVQTRIRSPQSINRVAAVINNQVHSPLKSDSGLSIKLSEQFERTDSPSSSSFAQQEYVRESPASRTAALKIDDKQNEFSPGSKRNLNSFAEFLNDTFGEDNEGSPLKNVSSSIKPPPPPSFSSLPGGKDSPTSLKLGSPVILNRTNNATEPGTNVFNSSSHLQPKKSEKSESQTQTATRKASSESLLAKSAGTTDPPSVQLGSEGAPSSGLQAVPGAGINGQRKRSVSSLKTPSQTLRSEIPLFVQPEEFSSIRVEVLSTLYLETESSTRHQQLLFSVIDRKSDKEMFKFSKSVQQLLELDAFLRPQLSSYAVPTLPDKSTFESLVPTKVDNRRESVSMYFYTMFSIPEFPRSVGLRIAQFMSTDTVVNPLILGDTVREGSLLMRRAKALSNGPNWRARYGVLGGEVLQLYDKGQSAERIRLKLSSIELLPNLPEDKYGTKNGFVINEHKQKGLSSTSRYYLCAETSRERELWISAISEFITNPLIPPSSSAGSISTGGDGGRSSVKTDHSSDYTYVTGLTNESNQYDTSGNSVSSQLEPDESADYDRDNRRMKMRSFFPFKKLTANALGMVIDDNETVESVDSETKFSDNSIAKSLETMNLGRNASNPNLVFGSSLEDCLQLSSQMYQGKYEIPSVVYRCLEFLYKNYGIQEEGIFRLSGSSALIKALQEQFDREYDVDLCTYNRNVKNTTDSSTGTYIDVNTVSGLLKLYLRKLPHLIFGEENYASFRDIVERNSSNPENTAYGLRELIRSGAIKEANLSLMYALFELLVRIQENNAHNKMNLRNLCIVFSPTLNIPVSILQPLIVDFNCIFKNEAPVPKIEREELDIHIPRV